MLPALRVRNSQAGRDTGRKKEQQQTQPLETPGDRRQASLSLLLGASLSHVHRAVPSSPSSGSCPSRETSGAAEKTVSADPQAADLGYGSVSVFLTHFCWDCSLQTGQSLGNVASISTQSKSPQEVVSRPGRV